MTPKQRAKQITDALWVLSEGAIGCAHPDAWQEYIAEAIQEAREKALEEAAKVADNADCNTGARKQIAAAIRALKDTGNE
jgi:hypothetical protein